MGARNGRAPDAFCVVLGQAIRTRVGAELEPELLATLHPHSWPPPARMLALAVASSAIHGGRVPKHMIEAAIAAQWGELR